MKDKFNELFHDLGALYNLETNEDDELALKKLKLFVAEEVIASQMDTKVAKRYERIYEECQ